MLGNIVNLDVEWKPKVWICVVLGLFFQPMVFLYIQRIGLFWLYFLVLSTFSIVDFYFNIHSILVFSVLCPAHAYWLIKNVQPTNKRKWYSFWWGIIFFYVLTLIPIVCIRAFLYEPYSVPASSMSPTLNGNDHILVKKYGFGNYGTYGIQFSKRELSNDRLLERGKMYVFYPPHLDDVPFVKRLVGMPGDTIGMINGDLFINGQKMTSTYLKDDGDFAIYQEKIGDISYEIQKSKVRSFLALTNQTIPEKNYFFLGDNRDNSADSRVWGYVSSQRLIGEVVYVFN